jgi:hypothetical protein
MLVELAAANAAFAVIKETISNTGELMNAGKALSQLFDSEATLRKRLLDKSGDTINTDAEEFFALEQIRVQKEELEQAMTYYGRPGLINDWRTFQAKAAKQRKEAQEEEIRRKMRRRVKIIEGMWWGVLAIVLAFSIYFTITIITLFRDRA